MPTYRYKNSHCGDWTILQPSYIHNGISYTGKTTSWRRQYWIRALVVCEGNSSVTCGFPSRRNFGVFFDDNLNKRLNTQLNCRWFETPCCSLWRHCYVAVRRLTVKSRKTSKSWDMELKLFCRPEIWQTPVKFQSDDNLFSESRGFETSRDLAVRRLIS